MWPSRDTLSFTRFLMFYGEGSATEEHETACKYIIEAREIRKKYHGRGATLVHSDFDAYCAENRKIQCRMGSSGVMGIFIESVPDRMVHVPSIEEFTKDYSRLVHICTDGMMRTFW